MQRTSPWRLARAWRSRSLAGSIEVLAKDYIASFKSVRDTKAFGVEGRRAHTLLLLISARLGL